MEIFAPLVEILRGGSPWLILVAQDMALLLGFMRALVKEQLRIGPEAAREIAYWREQALTLKVERDQYLDNWLAAEKRTGDAITLAKRKVPGAS